MTFRILVALEFVQYLDNHAPQRFDFCIECTPTDRTCQLYHHQVKIMFIYEGTNNLVSGAFLKCFSIHTICLILSFQTDNPGQKCKPRSYCTLRGSLIRVITDCNSFCILGVNFFSVHILE